MTDKTGWIEMLETAIVEMEKVCAHFDSLFDEQGTGDIVTDGFGGG